MSFDSEEQKIKQIAELYGRTDLTADDKAQQAVVLFDAQGDDNIHINTDVLMDIAYADDTEYTHDAAVNVCKEIIQIRNLSSNLVDDLRIWAHSVGTIFFRYDDLIKDKALMHDGTALLIDEGVERGVKNGQLGEIGLMIEWIACRQDYLFRNEGLQDSFYFKPQSLNNPALVGLIPDGSDSATTKAFLQAQTPAEFMRKIEDKKPTEQKVSKPVEPGEFFDCDGTLLYPDNLPLMARVVTLRQFGKPATIFTRGDQNAANEKFASFGINQADVQNKDDFKGKKLDVVYDDTPVANQGLEAVIQKDPHDTDYKWDTEEMAAAYRTNLAKLEQKDEAVKPQKSFFQKLFS